MSTPSVSRYYNTRKRGIKHEDLKIKTLLTVSEDVDSRADAEKVQLSTKSSSVTKTEKDTVNLQRKAVSSKNISRQKKPVAAKKDKKSIATDDKKSKGNQPTLAAFFTSDTGELKTTKSKKEPKKKNAKPGCFSCVVQRDSSDPETTNNLPETVQRETQSVPQSPKRNLPAPSDEGSPFKKKHLEENVPTEKETCALETTSKPKQKETARRKLQLDPLPSKSINVNSPNCKLVPETTIKLPETVQLEIRSVPQSPKRNLPASHDEGTPSKKKHVGENVPSKKEACASERTIKPKQKETARRKLQLDSLPSKSINVNSPNTKLVSASPKKMLPRTPDKLDALIDQSRSKLLLSPKLGLLKKSLELFEKTTSKVKEFPSNRYGNNTVISTSKSPVKTVRKPSVFANERFSHLIEPESSFLILPSKYRVLFEMFRHMDAVVSLLNNRKEKITFDKVKEGVQNITKKNFSEKNLGQIVTIMPTAYNLSREKCSYISKKTDSLEYQLVISPNLTADEDSNKKTAFIPMNPPCLASRTNEFKKNILELVKEHHQDFLTRKGFVTVSKDSITRWHPKFLLDSVPDVPVAPLPESPESKVYTARDVLNKLIGSIPNKVGKALQSVVDESEKSNVTLELKQISNPETSKKDLKNIATDLLERVRAKESANLLKTMTQSPAESKRLAMEERVPKIVNILWHYFIAERKAAVHIDIVVDKIIHSCNSLTTPDDVKDHLKLIADKFDGWLIFKEIPKGVYITVDKNININEMLDKAGLNKKQ